jgi:hypothetical protein
LEKPGFALGLFYAKEVFFNVWRQTNCCKNQSGSAGLGRAGFYPQAQRRYRAL